MRTPKELQICRKVFKLKKLVLTFENCMLQVGKTIAQMFMPQPNATEDVTPIIWPRVNNTQTSTYGNQPL